MLFDLAITLAGQPQAYWHDPLAASEGNVLVRLVMHQGYKIFVALGLGYIAAMILAQDGWCGTSKWE